MPGSGFDIEGARKAGYSDDEIIQYLTESRKFDVDSAIKSGYSKPEIIEYLSTSPARQRFQIEQTPESKALEAADIGQNILGAAKGIGNLVMTGYQWGQDIPRQVRQAVTGEQLPSRVTPTPAWLQPNGSAQVLGQDIALGAIATPIAGAGVKAAAPYVGPAVRAAGPVALKYGVEAAKKYGGPAAAGIELYRLLKMLKGD